MEKLLLSVVVLVTLLVNLTAACPTACRCDTRRKIVYCNERRLVRIPYDIPNDTRVLLLQGNALTNGPSLEPILRSLSQLERLDMHNNQLTSFPNHLPPSLTYLSLRSNSIKFVGKNVISGLVHLEELYLDLNQLTDAGLADGTFSSALGLKDLKLSNNKLTKFPLGLPKNLESFRIASNNISEISSSAINNLEKLLILDLSFNRISDSEVKLDFLRELKTLDLNGNLLENVPVFLPENLTELRLDSNRIRFVYARQGRLHGTLRGLKRLKKVDLSSNRLESVENKAFSSLPLFASVELHDNPWRCDCNLIYLKKWITFTSLLRSKARIVCNQPSNFKRVTLQAIDQEALTCPSSTVKPRVIRVVDPSSVIIRYDVGAEAEPPYVTYSVMYGVMLCGDCALHGGTTSSSHAQARLWMKDYTISPITGPGLPTEITGLESNTRYVVCVLALNQHPDLIGVDQCTDFRTLTETTELAPLRPQASFPPTWALILVVVMVVLIIIVAVAIAAHSYRNRRRRQSFRSYPHGSRRYTFRSSWPANGPSEDANPEFTLVVAPSKNRHNGGSYSDSRDDSFNTIHTDTTTSLSSGNEMARQPDDGHYERPFINYPPTTNDNYDRLKFNTSSALFL